ncbi:MAG: AtpZ/AtpI family protein [Pedobacter sp.]|nr:MAG: AtpZ/AtpI family protein [Pedobacter sp.]
MKNPIKQTSVFAKYSAIAFQMILIIGVFTFIGHKIDQSQQTRTPLYTAAFSLVGVFVSLYLVIKGLKSITNSKNTRN